MAFFVFALIVIVYLVFLTLYLVKLKNHYQRLVNVSGKDNLKEILEVILDKLEENSRETKFLEKTLAELKNQGKFHIQKIGFVRYNPFSDIGGDQSFVFAFLDGNSSGIVLRSLHNRNVTRWFAKNVKNGKGMDYELTKEENEAVMMATKTGVIN